MATRHTLPTLTHRAEAGASTEQALPARALQVLPLDPGKRQPLGGHWYRCDVPPAFFAHLPATEGEVASTVLENNAVLGPKGPPHGAIAAHGLGRCSVWYNPQGRVATVLLSSSDNSDPRRNGREYTVLNQPLRFHDDWHLKKQRGWLSHS